MKIPVTFTITSCNRIDLIEKTINSFFNLNNYQIDEFIMSDDSDDLQITKTINEKFGDRFRIISNTPRIGLSKSLDNLFNQSKNEYIFHCEDDWFFNSNPNLISESLDILIENKDIHQVSVRHQYDNPHKSVGEVLLTKNGVKYRLMNPNFTSMPTQTWNGYSWNPGLRRKSDYLKMFPNGISSFGDEYLCCEHTKQYNYCSVVLENTSCSHLGYNNRTKNFIV
jgi:hypothetical protein